MQKLLCPQCQVGIFYVLNAQGDRCPVYVTKNGEIVPKNPGSSLEGFNLDEVYCMGCSWHGSPKRLQNYRP
ncbi:hypothetical protein [uncultured Bacteroides sp.]|uniref:hypothetical protein n=1 Tax=uncultured Bacteroides sp. TaxID=162156 RepID=UPI002629935E|nr:hypothetical protein [uncultured Bacteroides sp.]